MDTRAPSVARSFVREMLQRWRLDGLVDSVTLATSELVTNAVRHGLPPLHLRLHRLAGKVRLDVSDGRPGALPDRPQPGPGQVGGWGLPLVRRLSSTFGVTQIPDDGKSVHATFIVDGVDR